MTKESLNTFEIPGHVQPDTGAGGLSCFQLRGQGSTATVYLHGAHVTAFQPEDSSPVLWMSECSQYADGFPIRGGIPICWPWFGPHPCDDSQPAHGVARLRAWTPLEASVLQDGRCRLRLGFTPEGEECRLVPPGLRLEYTITVGHVLSVELDTVNEGSAPVAFEDALHAYFALTDATSARVTGLEGAPYLDRMDGMATKVQSGPVRFEGETDRVYFNPNGETRLEDNGRSLRIIQRGAANTVVWNPWITKSNAMPDFGDDEWKGMCCVEAVNCLRERRMLLPGTRHRSRMEIAE
ncbi:MAG: D-hexose-6-phosphate mutarotase [Kiritimatiellae bacterium]|nr:D-hexose-6-phosphate mutarotase [Kiritimatiellia bacterium]